MKQDTFDASGKLTPVFRNGVRIPTGARPGGFALTEPSAGSDVVLRLTQHDQVAVNNVVYKLGKDGGPVFNSPLRRAMETVDAILAQERDARASLLAGENVAQACREGIPEGFTAMKPLQLKRGFSYVM